MTIYGNKQQHEKSPGFYYSLEKDLEEWNKPQEEKQVKYTPNCNNNFFLRHDPEFDF